MHGKYGHLLYFYIGIVVLLVGLMFAQNCYQDTKLAKSVSGRPKSVEPKEKKRIALTFDDGPSMYTSELLDGLEERDVHASFFLLGECIEGKEDIVKKIYDGGNLIGNHTFTHERLDRVPEKKACEKIERTSNMIYDITGEYTVFVRPPYGEWRKGLDLKVQMIPVFWDIDSLDWTTHDVKSVVSRVVKNAHDGAIILMHDCSKSSVQAALEIIDTLQKNGYTFVTVDDLVFE